MVWMFVPPHPQNSYVEILMPNVIVWGGGTSGELVGHDLYLENQNNSYQNAWWHFYKNLQADPKIHMEVQGAQNSQTNLEKEKQSCRTHTSKNRELRTEVNPHIYNSIDFQ